MGIRTIVIVMKYSINQMMDLDKLSTFKSNLEEFKKSGNELKIVFYGEYTNEELSVNMTLFNRFVNSKVCDYAISFLTKDIVIESDIHDRTIAQEKTDITEKNIEEQVKKLYGDDNIEISLKSNNNWENVLLDLKEE